jgi:hypothetical protein
MAALHLGLPNYDDVTSFPNKYRYSIDANTNSIATECSIDTLIPVIVVLLRDNVQSGNASESVNAIVNGDDKTLMYSMTPTNDVPILKFDADVREQLSKQLIPGEAPPRLDIYSSSDPTDKALRSRVEGRLADKNKQYSPCVALAQFIISRACQCVEDQRKLKGDASLCGDNLRTMVLGDLNSGSITIKWKSRAISVGGKDYIISFDTLYFRLAATSAPDDYKYTRLDRCAESGLDKDVVLQLKLSNYDPTKHRMIMMIFLYYSMVWILHHATEKSASVVNQCNLESMLFAWATKPGKWGFNFNFEGTISYDSGATVTVGGNDYKWAGLEGGAPGAPDSLAPGAPGAPDSLLKRALNKVVGALTPGKTGANPEPGLSDASAAPNAPGSFFDKVNLFRRTPTNPQATTQPPAVTPEITLKQSDAASLVPNNMLNPLFDPQAAQTAAPTAERTGAAKSADARSGAATPTGVPSGSSDPDDPVIDPNEFHADEDPFKTMARIDAEAHRGGGRKGAKQPRRGARPSALK